MVGLQGIQFTPLLCRITFYWSGRTKPRKWAVMCVCVSGLIFPLFLSFRQLDFGTIVKPVLRGHIRDNEKVAF